MVFDGQVSAEPFADEIAGAVGRNEIAFVGEILDVQRHAVVVDHIAPAGFLDDEVFCQSVRGANASPDNRPVASQSRDEVVTCDRHSCFACMVACPRSSVRPQYNGRNVIHAISDIGQAPGMPGEWRRQILLDPGGRLNRLSAGLFLVLSHIWTTSIDRNCR